MNLRVWHIRILFSSFCIYFSQCVCVCVFFFTLWISLCYAFNFTRAWMSWMFMLIYWYVIYSQIKNFYFFLWLCGTLITEPHLGFNCDLSCMMILLVKKGECSVDYILKVLDIMSGDTIWVCMYHFSEKKLAKWHVFNVTNPRRIMIFDIYFFLNFI